MDQISLPDEVALEKVKPDRRELDKIIMGDILGLSDAMGGMSGARRRALHR